MQILNIFLLKYNIKNIICLRVNALFLKLKNLKINYDLILLYNLQNIFPAENFQLNKNVEWILIFIHTFRCTISSVNIKLLNL